RGAPEPAPGRDQIQDRVGDGPTAAGLGSVCLVDSMAHDPRFSDLLPAYALGALDGEELRELERHLLDGCHECGADLARWRRQVDLLAESVAPVQPSSGTRARLLEVVEEAAAVPSPAPAPPSLASSPRAAPRRLAPWLAGLAAAAAIALLIRAGSLD